eukprot:scaffold149_cov315-Pinguiococcus_pyrenoidosus.AAC.76
MGQRWHRRRHGCSTDLSIFCQLLRHAKRKLKASASSTDEREASTLRRRSRDGGTVPLTLPQRSFPKELQAQHPRMKGAESL